MAKRQILTLKGVKLRPFNKEAFYEATLEVDDVAALMVLAHKAARNKSHRAHTLGGRIIVKVRPIA